MLPPLPLVCVVMKRYRVHWVRRVLECVLIFCVVSCVIVGVMARVLDNGVFVSARWPSQMYDDVPPFMELKGGESITIAVDSEFEDLGVEAYDYWSEMTLVVEGEVDTTQVGEYELKYIATDENGNRAEIVRTVNVIEPTGRIYLTFDDGPSDFTGALLDLLKKYGVRATFFVTGYGDDALIRREYDEGHAVGLHTFSHVYANVYTSVDSYIADLNAVQDRVQRITGEPSKLLRFPGGSSNLISARYDGGVKIMSQLVGLITERGLTYFDWNVDSGDAGGASTSDEVYANVINTLKVGGDSIVLQHDIKSHSVDAVEKIVQYGLEHGYVFDRLKPNSFTAHHGINN